MSSFPEEIRNIFSTLYNPKTASPQRNEKAGFQIHYDRATRLLLSEVHGESNSFWQADVSGKLVSTLLDKCLGSGLLGTSRKHSLLLGIKRSTLLFCPPTGLFSIRALLDRCQALLCWEGIFCPFFLTYLPGLQIQLLVELFFWLFCPSTKNSRAIIL